jgi:transposase
MDISQPTTAEGKAYLYVAAERKTRYAYVELFEKMDAKKTVQFLENLIATAPFRIHTILTDNGAQFTYRLLAKHLQSRDGAVHPFDSACLQRGIQHRLTQFKPPWTGAHEPFNQGTNRENLFL